MTRDDFPYFRITEFDDLSIRATVTWLISMLCVALELPVVKPDWISEK